MSLARGDVVLVTFPFASGQGAKRRPAVVVQSDDHNARLQNTIVAMITSTTHRAARSATQFLIDPASADGQSSGLLMRSAVTCENLLTVAQDRVSRKIGRLTPGFTQQLDACLRAALDLA